MNIIHTPPTEGGGGVTNTALASVINAATVDANILDADQIPLTETAAGGALRRATFATVWAWITGKLAALTSLTVGGAWNFSSTTRPTSSGTGTPAANSLIRNADLIPEINQQIWQPVTFTQAAQSGSGAQAVNHFVGATLTLNNTASGAFAVVTTEGLTSPFTRVGSGEGYAMGFGAPSYSIVFAASSSGLGTTEWRLLFGVPNNNSIALSAAGFGVAFDASSGQRRVRLQYHNGTLLAESTPVNTGGGLGFSDFYMLTFSQSNGLRLWQKISNGNNIYPRWALLTSLPCPNLPLFTAGDRINFAKTTLTNDALNRVTVLRFAKMLNTEITPIT